jgi:hypothetical protein
MRSHLADQACLVKLHRFGREKTVHALVIQGEAADSKKDVAQLEA